MGRLIDSLHIGSQFSGCTAVWRHSVTALLRLSQGLIQLSKYMRRVKEEKRENNY